MRRYLYIALVFLISCDSQKKTESNSQELEQTKIMYAWSDKDSTIIELNDYSQLIESLTSDDTSLTEFMKVFASVKSKPEHYDELAAIMDLHWLYILHSQSDNSYSKEKEENIHIKKSNLFKNLNTSDIEFKCITKTAPIDSWYVLKSDGQLNDYYSGLTKYKWELKNDTLKIKYDSLIVFYIDKDSVFEPTKPGHPLIIIYRK